MKTEWTDPNEDIIEVLARAKQAFSQSVGYYPEVISLQEYKRLQEHLNKLVKHHAEQSQVISSPKV